jgi:hypothetical protein
MKSVRFAAWLLPFAVLGAAPAALAMPEAESVWRLRAALNVAALQCQFDPSLRAVDNYNDFLKTHKKPLDEARRAMERRMGVNAFDRYNTRTYNSFTAINEQVAFCKTSSDVAGRANALTSDTEFRKFAKTGLDEIVAVFPKPEPKVAAKPKTKPKAKGKGKAKGKSKGKAKKK